MAIDNRIGTKDGLIDVDSPMKSHHDMSTTLESIKTLLANGTPNWVKWPEDYRQFVKEEFAAEKEISDKMASEYKLENQHLFENREARMVNPISSKVFVDKLRANGVKCFVIQNPKNRQQAGLWAVPPTRQDKARYICFIQLPAMYEWSVVNLNAHGVADGEAYRGWRTVLMEGIKKEIWTEAQAHEWFGTPAPNTTSSVYYKSLFELRNRKYWKPEFTEK